MEILKNLIKSIAKDIPVVSPEKETTLVRE
jgi:hypothetical protein